MPTRKTLVCERVFDPSQYHRRVTPFLLRDEVRNNLLLGVAGEVAAHPDRFPHDNLFLVVYPAGDPSDVRLAMLQTPPFGILVSQSEADAIPPAISWLRDSGRDWSQVHTTPGQAKRIHAAAQPTHGIPNRTVPGGHWVYELDRLLPPDPPVAGRMRVAEWAADADRVTEWVAAFTQEGMGATITAEAARSQARPMVEDGAVHLWIDPAEQVVSMAIARGRTPNGIRISYVYTPPEHRRRGYGSAVTAALTQAMLDAGRRTTFLFTDSANPTSNAIYRRLGYRYVDELTIYDIVPTT